MSTALTGELLHVRDPGNQILVLGGEERSEEKATLEPASVLLDLDEGLLRALANSQSDSLGGQKPCIAHACIAHADEILRVVGLCW